MVKYRCVFENLKNGHRWINWQRHKIPPPGYKFLTVIDTKERSDYNRGDYSVIRERGHYVIYAPKNTSWTADSEAEAWHDIDIDIDMRNRCEMF